MDALLDSDPLTVSGYTLHSRLGEGAYGVVYAASHARFGRVALKVLRPTLANIPQVRARLRAEAQALQRVSGTCIAAEGSMHIGEWEDGELVLGSWRPWCCDWLQLPAWRRVLTTLNLNKPVR